MKTHFPANCIVPPHILQKLLESTDRQIRDIALSTLLATTQLRAERRMLAEFGFVPNVAGEKRRTIYDCKNRRVLENAHRVRGEADRDLKDQAVNRAFEGLGYTYDFFKSVLARNSIDNRGMRLDGYVHYGQLYNNAFWNGRQMVFGDGDGRVFTDFTKSLDVIAHELTHGVTEFSAGLEYHNESGALNESISDVFGSLVKQWKLGQTADQAEWLIGAEVFTPAISGDALRSLKSPGRAYDDPLIGRDPQPAHMDNFVHLPDTEEGDWGGVHINSGIPNHAFYLTAMTIGGKAWEAPGHIWYETLKSVGQETDFQEFADKSYHISGRLYGIGSREQQAIGNAWKEVGIRVSGVAPAADSRSLPLAIQANGQSTLTKQIASLANQLDDLAKDVAQLKAGAGMSVHTSDSPVIPARSN